MPSLVLDAIVASHAYESVDDTIGGHFSSAAIFDLYRHWRRLETTTAHRCLIGRNGFLRFEIVLPRGLAVI